MSLQLFQNACRVIFVISKKTIIILTTSVCAGFLFIIVNYIDANQLLIVNLQ